MRPFVSLALRHTQTKVFVKWILGSLSTSLTQKIVFTFHKCRERLKQKNYTQLIGDIFGGVSKLAPAM